MIRVAPRYAEFAAGTNYSFLRGASHPEEMVARAAELGLAGLGIADRNTLAGVVRAYVFARENAEALAGMRVVVGARLVFRDGTPDLLAYPRDRAAYGRLCRLLSTGNLRAPKGECHLDFADLVCFGEGLQIVALPGPGSLGELREAFGERLWIGATASYDADMRGGLARRAAQARKLGARLLALNDAIMHVPERRPLADVVACIREGVTLEAAGRLTHANAERHLKNPAEMTRLFAESPEAVAQTLKFLEGLAFSLDELAHVYPEELREGFATPQAALEAFTRDGARERYPEGAPASVEGALAHELKLIRDLNYAPYFLTVYDIVRFARSRGILCQGRGSAANSTVCFCLGITEVDPARFDLLFERFLSPERDEPPDIDVDFEHERREEVIQYIYAKYGRERAGLASAVTTYRSRSAIRETAKVFGLSEDVIVALNGSSWGREKEPGRTVAAGLDLRDPNLAMSLKMAEELSGFPRHLTQHSGGFVITRDRLDEVAPLMNTAMDDRTSIEWDKDDLDALGLLKIDVLALGMLTALAKGFRLLDKHYGKALRLSTVPPEEACVYAMIQRADTIGVFQIESRAQMSMLPRLKPAKFYDLVIEVAIVRPGPIQGDMVHPYLRRRQGLEPVVFPSSELEAVLGKTLGVPLFQEQAMRIAILAGFTPAEADKLRRAMATFRRVGTIQTFQNRMVEGLAAKGYDREFAARCFRQIEGFGEYGFPESHAASFALLVYASCWMKCRYPDVFLAALLNAQPLGFYSTSQLVRDAREHGVEVREVDVNFSDWDATLAPPFAEHGPSPPRGEGGRRPDEGGLRFAPLHRRHAGMAGDIKATHAVRLGLRQINGVREKEMQRLVERRGGAYDSVRDIWLRGGATLAGLEKLAEADAFRSLGLDRREALWAVKALNRVGDQNDLPLFAAVAPEPGSEPDAKLPPMPLGAHVVEDYRRLSLSLKAHPVAFMRSRLAARGIVRTDALEATPGGARVIVSGLVLVRQRPGTAKGVIFMTIEDEAGVANIIVWPKVFERMRALVIGARFVAVAGRLQNERGVIHVIAEKFEDWTPALGQLAGEGRVLDALIPADEVKRPVLSTRTKPTPRLPAPLPAPLAPELRRALPGGRNFH